MMNILSQHEIDAVVGGMKIHFNITEVLFTTIAATLIGGPAGAGMAIAAAIATQGVGNLRDLAEEKK